MLVWSAGAPLGIFVFLFTFSWIIESWIELRLNYHQQWQERERGRGGLTAEVARPQESSSITSRASGRGPRSGSRWRRWFSERKQDEKTKLTSESEAKTEPRRES